MFSPASFQVTRVDLLRCNALRLERMRAERRLRGESYVGISLKIELNAAHIVFETMRRMPHMVYMFLSRKLRK